MPTIDKAGEFKLGHRKVRRMGYGAMQLAGPHVFGPPKDRAACIAVLREAVASGVNHIDFPATITARTSPTRSSARRCIPIQDDLVIVTKVGARRDDKGAWLPAMSPAELKQAIHDNLGKREASASTRWRSSTCSESLFGGVTGHGGSDPLEAELDRAGRVAAPGPDPPHRPQQRHVETGRGWAQDLRDRLRAEHVQPRPAQGRWAGGRTGEGGHALRSFLPAWWLRSAAILRACRMRQPTATRRTADAQVAQALAAEAFAEHPADPRNVVGCAPFRGKPSAAADGTRPAIRRAPRRWRTWRRAASKGARRAPTSASGLIMLTMAGQPAWRRRSGSKMSENCSSYSSVVT